MTISMAGLPAFLLYFCLGVALIASFAAVYIKMTAHDELALIRGGNLSAAVALGGNLAGFSIPLEVKELRKEKQYLLIGMRLNRDTERMVMSDMIYAAAQPAGWVLIQEPTDKERRFCKKLGLELIEADVFDLIGAAIAA